MWLVSAESTVTAGGGQDEECRYKVVSGQAVTEETRTVLGDWHIKVRTCIPATRKYAGDHCS